jgi:hypothetical protein
LYSGYKTVDWHVLRFYALVLQVKPECPLCKQSFKSIIHNVRSIDDYDEYHLQTETENPDPWNGTLNLEIVQRFRYRYKYQLFRKVGHEGNILST